MEIFFNAKTQRREDRKEKQICRVGSAHRDTNWWAEPTLRSQNKRLFYHLCGLSAFATFAFNQYLKSSLVPFIGDDNIHHIGIGRPGFEQFIDGHQHHTRIGLA